MIGQVGRSKALVSTALRQGSSISAIVNKMRKAALQLYLPRSYEEQEYRAAFLLWKFGGARAARISHAAMNLPSLRTIQRHAQLPALQVSSRYPSQQEVAQNIRSMYSGAHTSPFQRTIGQVLLVDELAVELRLRYDAANNVILGPCREHTEGYSMEFQSMDEADLILDALRNGTIHLSSEVSVNLNVIA
jgi:hypothetical protein